MRILGIRRSVRFSPNSIDRDERIFMSVASLLHEDKYDVTCISEDDFPMSNLDDYPILFCMARDISVLRSLEGIEEQGTVIVNSPRGIINCGRHSIIENLEKSSVPHPRSWIIRPKMWSSYSDKDFLQYPCWLKRGDGCTQYSQDVCFVNTKSEMEELLRLYELRHIDDAVISEHLEGDLVKFYGVEGTPFFYFYYPTEKASNSYSKFGLEDKNGTPHKYSFDADLFKKTCDNFARNINVVIYGGDCVVDSNGFFRIIDFNDWPSFSACVNSASVAIKERIIQLKQFKYE